jgi:hypothetical protein
MRLAVRVLIVVVVSFAVTAGAASVSAQTFAASKIGQVVNVIDTSAWAPSAPDPTGLAFVGKRNATKRLLVIDSEADETPLLGGNMWRVTRAGSVLKSWDISAWNPEPAGIAVNKANGHYFIAKDGTQEIFEIDRGTDGKFETADDIRRSFNTAAYAMDPEALSFGGGKLWIGDGAGGMVVALSPGGDATFGTSDDSTASFSTSAVGVNDPEGIRYVKKTGTLFMIGNQPNADIVEVTSTGTWVRTIDLVNVPLVAPGGLEYGPSSTDPTGRSFYVADRGVDNSEDPNENDGKIYEIVEADVPPGTNLLGNGDFEADANNDGLPDVWTTNEAFTRSSAVVKEGSFAGRHESGSDASYSVRQVVDGITAGTSYDFTGSVNIPATSDAFTFIVRVTWQTATGTSISTNQLAILTSATDGWADQADAVTAPAGAVKARVIMFVQSLSATIYVDSFSFAASP